VIRLGPTVSAPSTGLWRVNSTLSVARPTTVCSEATRPAVAGANTVGAAAGSRAVAVSLAGNRLIFSIVSLVILVSGSVGPVIFEAPPNGSSALDIAGANSSGFAEAAAGS